MPTRRGTSRTALGCRMDMRLHESHWQRGRIWRPQLGNTITRNAASYTTNDRFVPFLGTIASLSTGLAAGQRPPGSTATWDAPPLCQLKRLHGLRPRWQQPSPRLRPAQAAALLPTRTQTRSLSPQAPRTTATANSLFRSSTASMSRSRGVRFPRRLPALRTSSPLGPGPFRRNAVSPSSSPRNGPSSGPCAGITLACVLSSSASSTCLRSTRPRSRNPLSALK
jgi:hypothetical protein